MTKTTELKQIISENKNNIAFVIGNGIHYQYHDCDITWDGLLKELWKEYTGEENIDLDFFDESLSLIHSNPSLE